MCGGTYPCGNPKYRIRGLSPRVRGNLYNAVDKCPSMRSIPACAGEPAARNVCPELVKVYPRVCGGTDVELMRGDARSGLSPRVRGNRSAVAGGVLKERSIPACAGEPSGLPGRRRKRSVYPRVCGGTVAPRRRQFRHYGLSPRVRGNHRKPPPPVQHKRSVPACAGEPIRQSAKSRLH